jgi:hypothetical protein
MVTKLALPLLLIALSLGSQAADEFPIAIAPMAKQYVKEHHLSYLRSEVPKLVGSDELDKVRVVIWNMGFGIRAFVRLPGVRDGTYSIDREIELAASDWPSISSNRWREEHADISWLVRRRCHVKRIFELWGGDTVTLPVTNGMSFVETRCVLEAVDNGAIEFSCPANGVRLPKVNEVFLMLKWGDKIQVFTQRPGCRRIFTVTRSGDGLTVHKVEGGRIDDR